MELSKIVQESECLRHKFVQELSAKVKHFSCGQYIPCSSEMFAFKDGVVTAIGMMSIDLLGAVKTKGMLEKFAISSQTSLLKAELERKKGMLVEMTCFCGDFKDKYSCDGYCNCGAFIKNRRGYSEIEQGKMDGYNKAIQEDITYLQEQIEECRKLLMIYL